MKEKRDLRPKDLLRLERGLISRGLLQVAGVDEAGRGCLAGPVFAAAVILPPGLILPEVDDSKLLAPPVRERLFDVICGSAVAWSVASIEAEEIDRINIHRASLKAMALAVKGLAARPEFILIDGKFTLEEFIFLVPQEAVVEGDARSQTVAAASILAKVSRDRWMAEEEKKYPQYRFGQHKGYATEQHRGEIRHHGPTPLHRRSFRWM